MRPYGKPKSLEKRRLRAIRLLESNHSFRWVATKVGCSLSSVVRWRQAYLKKGKEGLHPKPASGRPSLLSQKQKKKLLSILVCGPLAAGYTTDLWTLKRVGEIIEKQFGIRYCLANLWKLMRNLDWSCQKPEKRARERNEVAIQHWKRYKWPYIKKN